MKLLFSQIFEIVKKDTDNFSVLHGIFGNFYDYLEYHSYTTDPYYKNCLMELVQSQIDKGNFYLFSRVSIFIYQYIKVNNERG